MDSQVADSACTATAYLTGVKGNLETIGVPGNVRNRDCAATNDVGNQVVSSMKWAQLAGKRTGVVSNMRVTHATPAGAYANVAQRDWECDGDIAKDPLADPSCQTTSSDIAKQLIERDTGRNLNVSGAYVWFCRNRSSEFPPRILSELTARAIINENLTGSCARLRRVTNGRENDVVSFDHPYRLYARCSQIFLENYEIVFFNRSNTHRSY